MSDVRPLGLRTVDREALEAQVTGLCPSADALCLQYAIKNCILVLKAISPKVLLI